MSHSSAQHGADTHEEDLDSTLKGLTAVLYAPGNHRFITFDLPGIGTKPVISCNEAKEIMLKTC